jgi:hypothetical protein
MTPSSLPPSSPPHFNRAGRPSKLGRKLEQKKIDEARQLTPEQGLLLALELSDVAAVLNRAR